MESVPYAVASGRALVRLNQRRMRSVPLRGSVGSNVQDQSTHIDKGDHVCQPSAHLTINIHDLITLNDSDTALAYFISFRSYGTWLHGDQRGSIDRVLYGQGDELPRFDD